MFFAPRRPTTRLLIAALYGAAAVFGQGLHLLACPDHDHLAGHDHEAHQEAAASRCPSQQPGAAIASPSLDGHDADQCPICQYHSQGQWHGIGQPDTHSSVLVSAVAHHPGAFWRSSLNRPLGARGPPSFSADLA